MAATPRRTCTWRLRSDRTSVRYPTRNSYLPTLVYLLNVDVLTQTLSPLLSRRIISVGHPAAVHVQVVACHVRAHLVAGKPAHRAGNVRGRAQPCARGAR
eukprot:3478008-Prymnesium_polylepis.1